jgi:hypothetical protein
MISVSINRVLVFSKIALLLIKKLVNNTMMKSDSCE